MRKLTLLAILAAATMMPGLAQAHSAELYRDRAEIRQDLARLSFARRYGNVHQERRALRELQRDRRELRQDRREWRRNYARW